MGSRQSVGPEPAGRDLQQFLAFQVLEEMRQFVVRRGGLEPKAQGKA